MAAQVAVTLVLLVGAGLLGRSFLRVLSVDPGFRTEQVVTLDLSFSGQDENAQRITRSSSRVLTQFMRFPGVAEAGITSDLPLGTRGYSDGAFALINPQQLSPQMLQLIKRGLSEF